MDWNEGDRLDLRGCGPIRVVFNGSNTELWQDADGDGAPDVHIVTILGIHADVPNAIIT
jgi:hypothetical protein